MLVSFGTTHTGRLLHDVRAARPPSLHDARWFVDKAGAQQAHQRLATLTAAGFGKAVSGKKGKGKGGFDTRITTSDAESDDRALCTCGSRRPYKGCCREFHEGAWAPTALDLCRARFSASVLGLEPFLVDNFHPDSNAYPGAGRRLKGAQLRTMRAFSGKGLAIVDIAHGGGANDEFEEADGSSSSSSGGGDDQLPLEPWIVMYAAQATADGPVHCEIDKYGKLNGRWLFWSSERTTSMMNKSVEAFCDRWFTSPNGDGASSSEDGEDGKGSGGAGGGGSGAAEGSAKKLGRYDFTRRPPRAPAHDAEPWYLDEWPQLQPQQQQQQQQQQQPQAASNAASNAASVAQGWVFLDDSKEPNAGDQKQAETTDRQRLRENELGWDDYLYRNRMYQ